jgi:hypothetical protein
MEAFPMNPMNPQKSYLYGETIPTPTNLQAKRMLQKLINRLGLKPVRVCRSAAGSCVICGKPITQGDEYRDAGVMARAHLFCIGILSKRIAPNIVALRER